MKEIVLKLEDFDFNGGTFGLFDDKKILIYGALPQEVVKVRIFGKKKNYYLGEILEIIENSPLRIKERERITSFHVLHGKFLKRKKRLISKKD
jgi:tRNA/tmRNA/rRNA uracil-C5-methylase (TrmA/RlmC/RlmD family)